MGQEVGLEDLRNMHPEVYASLKKLLAYDGNVEDMGLFFQVTHLPFLSLNETRRPNG